MKNLKNIAVVLFVITLASCSSDDQGHDQLTPNAFDLYGNANITFDAKVGDADFALDTPFTIDEQTYEFENLRYWVSNIELVNDKDEVFSVPNSYFLMEETKAVDIQDGAYTYPATKREVINLSSIPSGKYSKIRFSVGVDQTHNGNLSIQDGELSQLNGMTNVSWMWHTSYIFSSLIGKNTTASKTIKVETGLDSNYRSIEIALPTALVVSVSKPAALNLNLNVEKIIQGLDLVAKPTVGASAPVEMTIVADNFKNNVFSLKPSVE